MPFTIDGQWVPNKATPKSNQKPVKVRVEKRGKSILTVILNLNMTDHELMDLASKIKKELGCGGSVKADKIEIQGDKVEQVRKNLADLGIKSS